MEACVTRNGYSFISLSLSSGKLPGRNIKIPWGLRIVFDTMDMYEEFLNYIKPNVIPPINHGPKDHHVRVRRILGQSYSNPFRITLMIGWRGGRRTTCIAQIGKKISSSER